MLAVPDQRKYADFRDYVIMTVLLDTLCRINEVLSLKKDDIDYTVLTISISPEIAKSRKGRVVPIQKRTARLIKELIAETDFFDSEYVFLANFGEKMHTNHFRKRLTKLAVEAGIKKKVYPHLLRYTGATMFLESGGDIRHLQIILGHADLRMTMKYTHLSSKSILKQSQPQHLL
ncbi:tyrosine-type recombinase/integrase [Cytobacillus suaedae]|nr:tyrosine-type recombinase/integrase [Cytobacillus suaedae]